MPDDGDDYTDSEALDNLSVRTDRKCYLAEMQEVQEEKSGDNLSS